MLFLAVMLAVTKQKLKEQTKAKEAEVTALKAELKKSKVEGKEASDKDPLESDQ